MNNKGFALPALIFFLVAFVSLPVIFFMYVNRQDPGDEIKGTSTYSYADHEAGIGLSVTSSGGTWDVLEYLCKDLEECKDGLMSGKRLGSVSGGVVEDFKVSITPGMQWEGNTYLKVYAKGGWGSDDRVFSVEPDESVVQSLDMELVVEEMEYEGELYNVLIIPLEPFRTGFFEVARFSD